MPPRSLISLIGALAASAALAAPASAAVKGDVVYARGGDLHVLTADGGKRLTSGKAQDEFPAWSPDRRRLAFVRNGSLHVARADGTGIRRITKRAGDRYPAWAPNGRELAFASTRAGGEAEIYLVRRDGQKLRRLTRTARHVDDTQPAWTPDGKSLVFSSNRVAYTNYEIYKLRIASGGLQRLTFWGAGGDTTPGDDLMPDVSPDGTRIAFVSDREDGYGVWTMAIDGSDVRSLVRNAGSTPAFPRFSHDGVKLLYELVDEDGTNSRLITQRAAGDSMPIKLGAGMMPDW